MKKIYLIGAPAVALLLGGCSNDNMMQPDDPSQISEVDRTLYVSMSIKGDVPDGTRVSKDDGSPNDDGIDFATGTENDVNNAYFVFYDEDGNVVGNLVSVELGDPESTPVGPTVEQSYKSVVSVEIRKGEKKPTQVICYINPISPSTLQSPLDVIQTVSRTAFSTNVGNKTYFAMSNSVYYPEDTNGVSEDPQIAIPVNADALFDTETEAKAALNAGTNVVDIYVERYATKLALTHKDIDTYKTATRVYNATGYTTKDVTLKFKPEYWAVNGEANRTYVIKSLREESTNGTLLPNNYTFTALDHRINPLTPGDFSTPLAEDQDWDWNNGSYHRSYWGMSPAYFQSVYPEVNDDLEFDPALKNNLNQTYISYKELKSGSKGFGADVTDPQYFKETTVGNNALKSDNPAAAMASVILVGSYKVNLAGTQLAEGTPFYTYLSGSVNIGKDETTEADITEERPYVYFANKDNSADSKVEGGESMLRRFFAQCTVLYKKETAQDENGNDVYTRLLITNANDLAMLTGALEVAEISEKVKYYGAEKNAEVVDEDNAVQPDPYLKLEENVRSLQFKTGGNFTGLYILTADGYKEIVKDDATPTANQIKLTEANYTLLRSVGYAYYYTSGHAYFNIPVRHLGWHRPANANKAPNAEFDWSKVRVGDFGMVRNHSYTVNVNSIKGLATGIGGDDKPIIPPANKKNYYVAYTVKILKWVVVPAQDVDL